MKQKQLNEAKLIVNFESRPGSDAIRTTSMFDNRIGDYSPDSYIDERGVRNFQDIDDLKETLNWNLNGDPRKYKVKWSGRTSDGISIGKAYVFQNYE